MVILGINAYHGDASAAVLVDGQLVAAAEEERFNRIKHVAGFPARAIRYCLSAAGVKPSDIDHIAVARDSRARVCRKVFYALRMPLLALDRLSAHARFAGITNEIGEALRVGSEEIKAEVHRVEHHKAHLASSFFVSPFDEAALLSVDGLGDFASTMWGIGQGSKFKVQGSIAFPHSLGIFYTALTQYLGFWKYGDEYKVMGLGSYGEPEYHDQFSQLLKVNGGPGFSLGLDYFVHHKSGPEMTWSDGEPILGRLYSSRLISQLGPERKAGEPLDRRHRNIAASLQARLEDAIFAMLNRLYERQPIDNLCLAGGVAFNCAANGKILANTPFKRVYIQPAAGDAGLAIGAAFYVRHQILGQPRSFEMKHAYWGPAFSDHEIGQELGGRGEELEIGGCRITKLEDGRDLTRMTAKKIAEGKVVGWFQGRMEWGPRALGNRSILVDPRRPEMKELLNRRIKHREPFRPFAPSILSERVGEYFEESHPSPFMGMAYKVKPIKRSVIPAPTHVDGTGRLQTVTHDENPLYWELIKEFEKLTGVPVLVNTSFNDNEPIVRTPAEAVDCFLRTKMDVLALGGYLVEKAASEENQPEGA
ncbi:MAG: carbamoyltransferase [Deltaproteobacteria bacterium]|nr:carbamoyltransferase [Deltaproteobacteria bacterium]